MAKGSFGFDDFLKQMQAVKKMGGIKDMLKMMPGMGSQIGRCRSRRPGARADGGDHLLDDARRSGGTRT